MTRSNSGTSSRVANGIASDCARSNVAFEVATQRTFSPSATRGPSIRTNSAAVEPVPRPRRIPGLTNSSARAAARRLAAVKSIAVMEPRGFAALTGFGYAAQTIPRPHLEPAERARIAHLRQGNMAKPRRFGLVVDDG